MDTAALALRIVFTLGMTALTGWCLVTALRGGIRPARDADNDQWQIVGDPDWGVRWGIRATLTAVVTFAGAPMGWPRTGAAWMAVAIAAITVAYLLARVVLSIRKDGVTPATAALSWLLAGVVAGAVSGYAVLMSGSDAKLRAAESAADAQLAVNAQSGMVRNAVITFLVVFAVFAWLARRSYIARSFRTRRKERRKPGQSTRDARRRQTRAVRDPIPRPARPARPQRRGTVTTPGRNR